MKQIVRTNLKSKKIIIQLQIKLRHRSQELRKQVFLEFVLPTQPKEIPFEILQESQKRGKSHFCHKIKFISNSVEISMKSDDYIFTTFLKPNLNDSFLPRS